MKNYYYLFLVGFDGTSNVLAGKMFGIPLKGTNAHSMIMSYAGMADLKSTVGTQLGEGRYSSVISLDKLFKEKLIHVTCQWVNFHKLSIHSSQ